MRDKALTPDVVTDLRAKQSAAVTVAVASDQGVLRIIPVKPGWWLDDVHAQDAAPVVAVQDAEHRLPGWNPHDVAVRAGMSDVVAWMPRRNGGPGRRVRRAVPVPQVGSPRWCSGPRRCRNSAARWSHSTAS
ncbi:hypothetical protein [Dactylosporangium sp. NPDC050588]|uniref:hypothetical protein n=1 Tax=Dactylosporangium sp. NPDC050588 TaxID=3157211 RepID=UPI0033E64A22